MTHHFFPQQAKTMPRSLTLFIALLALLATHTAWALDPVVRRDILDTIRPAAATRAGQEVRIVVDTLNVDGDWALLAGSLVGKDNRPMKVELAKECSPELDRLLFAVLTRKQGSWSIKHLEICATEPPYWYLDQLNSAAWPCGLFAGLSSAEGEDLQRACLRPKPARPRKP
ncbi:MAG: hypothetical protein IPO35_01550 [Uliginosibacterium sp.]|nr:hypothetical protein [Uliginosibacterium sp.]